MLTSLQTIFERDLGRLRREIEQYENEADLWRVANGITNSGGNLCLHLVGNLQHFIGSVLGGTGYVRDREFEFNGRNVPREELLEQIDKTLKVVSNTLDQLDAEQLTQNYPIEVFKKPMTTEFFLIHLATHLEYHRGQVNYHRRLLQHRV